MYKITTLPVKFENIVMVLCAGVVLASFKAGHSQILSHICLDKIWEWPGNILDIIYTHKATFHN